MSSLADLLLNTAYHKGRDDIATEFYLPCMSRAMQYDRAVGFFSSAIYLIAWTEVKSFVERGGRMRVICSPLLSNDDIEAIEEGYISRTEDDIGSRLRDEVQRLLSDPLLSTPTRVLATLVALDVLDFKIAFVGNTADTRHKRIFHDKVGIFADSSENKVVFKGSMNETWSGLSLSGNLESVDVYVSWGGDRDEERINDEVQYFESLWSDSYPTISVRDFPDVAHQELIQAADIENWIGMVDEIVAEIDYASKLSADRGPNKRIPRPHQTNSLLTWLDRGRKGILEHATGSGKTYTALCAMRDALDRGETCLVIVPSKLLLEQWYDEIRNTFTDLDPQILLCGAGHSAWRSDGLLNIWSRPTEKARVIISTIQTASTDLFLSSIAQGEHIFIVIDEVHRAGSRQNSRVLSLSVGPRLGLSATPRRAGDIEGTRRILEFFDGIVPPPFTLKDAIESGTLTPYMYYVHQIQLEPPEQEDWDQHTNRIRQLYARYKASDKSEDTLLEQIKHLLISRARIVKQATAKVSTAVDIVAQHFRRDERQRWIVYCDAQTQLYDVLHALRDAGYEAAEYHTNMPGSPEQTLRNFATNGGILVSIKCLDEGVDIPSVTHALILASSKNPREFIQRRGRVLRRFPGKALAHVHDVVVLPGSSSLANEDSPPGNAILEGELARAIEFGRSAKNPGAVTDLQRIAVRFGLKYQDLLEEGYEDEEE